MEVSEKFCPVCKNKNEGNATLCIFCGAFIEHNPADIISTINVESQTKWPEEFAKSLSKETSVPNGKVAIYAIGRPKPFYLQIKKELVLGRKAEETSETFLDLSDLDGLNMGVSRRHLTIHKTNAGYEALDLSSTNGSWLNNERLIPGKFYPLKSGSLLNLGRLRLLVVYHSV